MKGKTVDSWLIAFSVAMFVVTIIRLFRNRKREVCLPPEEILEESSDRFLSR